MLIHNESYEDKIMRLRYEMLLMHSKTGQALELDKAEDFDSALDEVSRAGKIDSALEETSRAENFAPALEETPRAEIPRRQISTGHRALMTDLDSILSVRARQLRENTPASSQPDSTAGRDTVIAEAAHRYAQAMDISGQHDTVFVAPA